MCCSRKGNCIITSCVTLATSYYGYGYDISSYLLYMLPYEVLASVVAVAGAVGVLNGTSCFWRRLWSE